MAELSEPDLGTDRYRLLDQIGRGAFADVYLAYDEQLGLRVAIKVLHSRASEDEETRSRFTQEARLQRSIRHPGVMPVHDIGETSDGRPYTVMDYADRGTLEERMAALGRPATASEVVQLVQHIGQTLVAIHADEVVHRDLKPSNIVLSTKGRSAGAPSDDSALIADDEMVQLTDFGLAKDIRAGSGFTVGGGTMGYMAPEQRGTATVVDQQADVYAATAIVAELLTGKPLDPELRVSDGKVLTGVPHLSGLADSTEQILYRSLDIDPEKRPDGIETWIDVVSGAVGAEHADETAGVSSGRSSVMFIGVVAALALVGVIGGLYWLGSTSQEEESTDGASPSTTVATTSSTSLDGDSAPPTAEPTVIAPTEVGLGEKAWLGVDTDEATAVQWQAYGNTIDGAYIWIQPTDRRPATVAVDIGSEPDRQRTTFRLAVVERAPSDAACALADSSGVGRVLGLSDLTTRSNGITNECEYAGEDHLIQTTWHRGRSATAYVQYFRTLNSPEAIGGTGFEGWRNDDGAVEEIVVVDGEGDDLRAVSVVLSGEVDGDLLVDLAAELLERTDPSAEREASAEVALPSTELPQSCKLISAEELMQIVGQDLFLNLPPGSSVCQYNSASADSGAFTIQISYTSFQPVEDGAPSMIEILEDTPGASAPELVDGLGDEAYLIDVGLVAGVVVRSDDRQVNVVVGHESDPLAPRAAALEIAEVAAARVPAAPAP